MEVVREKRAFREYPDKLRDLVSRYDNARILELGGGRKPSFQISEMPDNVASYTVNDISESELALAAPEYDKACFDVAGDVSKFAGQYDVIFSRTLIEHVRDGKKMHRNILSLLRPGGVAFHMVPTLYSPPFIINKLLPERLTEKVLWTLFPNRRSFDPKFPAYYSWCYGNRDKMKKMLREAGYSAAKIDTYYGHGYFSRIPGLKQIDDAFSSLAEKRDWSSFGAYAHLTAYK